MESIKQFFEYMNDINFPYVVLRNWDNLPYDVQLGEHSDLDLLVYDYEHWREIFPDAKPEFPYPRVRMKVPIDDSYLYCDVRHVGDEYYPMEFEKAILETREFNLRGFFTPNPIHHRIALAYHAVHHKNHISQDYRRYLGNVEIEDLLRVLKSSNVGWVEPKDKSVGRFHKYWKGCTSIVESQGDRIYKTQKNWLNYNLIDNEFRIMSRLNSHHFPKVFCLNGSLEMENCGVPLMDSLPDNWREQMDEILSELNENKIIHRDIRIENFMVKDGIVKLIDFGWAIKEGEQDEIPVPSCLGYPNKPSWGFDDAYSMRAVIKQIEYEKEKDENTGD